MRIVKYVILFCCSLAFLSSCYEITESVTIDPSGKGTYVTTVDAGQLMSLVKNFAGKDSTMQDLSAFDQNIDSTVSLKAYADTAKDMDPEIRALMAKATLHIVIRSDSNVFKSVLAASFDNIKQLQKLQDVFARKGGGMETMGDILGGKGLDSSNSGMGMNHLGDVLQTTWSEHIIKRTLNRELYDQLMKDPTMDQAKQMAALMSDAKFTTVIKLPKPAKKVDSKSSYISDDRKTVTFERSLSEMFSAPEDFSFTIEY